MNSLSLNRPAVEERDLPLLELLAAAPERRVPADKVESLGVLLFATHALRSAEALAVSPTNGAPPSAPQLLTSFYSAARYRCVFRARDAYALTEEGQLYLKDLGLEPSDAAKNLVRDHIDRPAPEILREAERTMRRGDHERRCREIGLARA